VKEKNERNISVNDRARFCVDDDYYEGMVNFISYNGLLRINALIGGIPAATMRCKKGKIRS